MLYVFKSRASPDLIMFESIGRRLLQILGREPAPQGIITPEQMPKAMQALQKAIAGEAAIPTEPSSSGPVVTGADEVVTLKQRLLPMIDMMRRCHGAGKEITWGV